MEIYPSLISSDLLQLKTTLTLLDQHCPGYHLDIMDDHFVPNLTWGPAFINEIRASTKQNLNVHLMVQHPASWLERLALNPGDVFIFHHEAVEGADTQKKLIDAIHAKKWLAGIAINPKTSVESITTALPIIDHVLIMSVEPGFSGQNFILNAVQKVAPLLAKKKQLNKLFKIGMDGGIGQNNISSIAQHGVDYIAAASAIFGQSDPVAALQRLKQALPTHKD